MMIKKFRNIKVSGMSLVLPEREISIYDELVYISVMMLRSMNLRSALRSLI